MTPTEVVLWEDNPREYVILKGVITEKVSAGTVSVQWVKWEWDDLCKFDCDDMELSELALLTPELLEVLNELKAIYKDPWGLDPFELRRDELWQKAEQLCKMQIDPEKLKDL